MSATRCPPVPPILKPIQHYLKTATEHEQRDPVVTYWCHLYALQAGLKIDHKSPESLSVLTYLMDWLEKEKKKLVDNDAVTNEVAAQAHLENYALKLFLWADGEDRAARFNKNVVKAFYTAGMLFDVCTTFGELSEEVIHHRKYAKWKAAYIHNCLKQGETPIPGPMDEDNEGELDTGGASSMPPASDSYQPTQPSYPDPAFQQPSSSHSLQPTPNYGPSGATYAPPTTPEQPRAGFPMSSGVNDDSYTPTGGAQVDPDVISKAQKYCKWASSSLNYDDIPTAIDNLQKALQLLQTGKDS